MRKFLILRRLDGNRPVGAALQNAEVVPHGTFVLPKGSEPEAALPLDARFLFLEQGAGTVYHYDPETFGIVRYGIDLTTLLLGPEISAAAKGRALVRLRFTPRLDAHPRRDRVVFDTFIVAYHGARERGLNWDHVAGAKTVRVAVNRTRLVNLLVRVIETAAADRSIRVDALLDGAALDVRRIIMDYGDARPNPIASMPDFYAPV